MTPPEIQALLERAVVPEHSVRFMEAMSGGEAFRVGDFLFLAGPGWLIAVGYPLAGGGGDFGRALAEARRVSGARRGWAVAPELPPELAAGLRQEDRYYLLSADREPPPRPVRQAERAAARLRVEVGRLFTGPHRRLWAEFLARTPLPDTVRELYARTARVLEEAPELRLLDAWEDDGRLAASFLVDLAPPGFLTWLIGARALDRPVPHASDLLMLEMIRLARREGKPLLHLGLGVNPGIRRFKTKWGARPGPVYRLAAWEEPERLRQTVGEVMRHLAAWPREPMSASEYLRRLPPQRRFAMLWEIEKHGRVSWIAGAAHFFRFSFENSWRRLFERVDTVLFEGPLDAASLARVAAVGERPDPGAPRLIDRLGAAEIDRLERVVCGPRGFWARFFGLEAPDPPDVRRFLAATRPWMAFFSLWSRFLGRLGWRQSVDLEAWNLAGEMGRRRHAMETIDEQLETLEHIPIERIVSFFRACRQWRRLARRNLAAYLRGDLEAMMGTTIEFPSRTEQVIGRRDARFLERMRPFIERGGCAVFVGTAHMIELRGMLAGEGFALRRRRL